MGIIDSVLSATPIIRRWWWRQKWTSLDVPAEEWAKMDGMAEEMYDALKRVKSLETLIMDAATLGAGHGMNTTLTYTDVSGKPRSIQSVLDGSSATEDLLKGYHKQLDSQRREMMKIAVALGNWAADNAVIRELEEKTPIHVSLIAFVRNVKRIYGELSEARKGRTSSEFLRYALLDKEARQKRLAIHSAPERVKLNKPEPPPNAEPTKRKMEEPDESAERRKIAALLPEAFREQGVDVRFSKFTAGYAVTRYELSYERGQKLAKAEGAAAEIAMRLGVDRVAVSKAPDKPQTIYVDVPNKNAKTLRYKDAPHENGKFFVGMSIGGTPVFADMEELCHVLIAGTTGSGKSTFLNAVICSMIQASNYHEVQFIMIDPKTIELTPYDGIPHLARPVITEPDEAVAALEDAVEEMESRYETFREIGAKKLSEYNEKAAAPFPRLIIVIDELADLMMASDKAVESSTMRIAQKGRAAGIHLMIATQRPTKDVVTGLIKANIPSRIAFAVASAMESQIILSEKGGGAEKLCGSGDMLYKPNDGKIQRLQGAYIANEEIARIVKGVKF